MKGAIIFLLLAYTSAVAQDLQLVKATKQTINHGASPTSTTNYKVTIKKEKGCNWAIDSVINVYTQKSNEFNVFKVVDPTVLSSQYQSVKSFKKKDKGLFQITFASMKNRGSGRPGTPQDLMVPVADFTQGAIIYYTMGKKKKQLLVESFEEQETINAP
ncbi:MAG TPA: hypothetical protein VGC65_07590 [Bacteroidia bacterium]|jgi:hypothetical protein